MLLLMLIFTVADDYDRRNTSLVLGIVESVLNVGPSGDFAALKSIEIELVKMMYKHPDTGLVSCSIRCLSGKHVVDW